MATRVSTPATDLGKTPSPLFGEAGRNGRSGDFR